MKKPCIIVFASGTKEDGGSGFENLVRHSRGGDLDAEIVAVVSNHEHGGVRERADRLGIPFIFFEPKEHTHIPKYMSMFYQDMVERTGAEWVALSGWLKKVEGLDPAKTFNIHPALLSFDNGRFGGTGLYGHHVHEAVAESLLRGEIFESGPTMHFTTDEYDRGPIFFEYRVPLAKGMTADDIASVVNAAEHEWQPRITNMVVHGDISWDGNNPTSLTISREYAFLPRR